MVKCAIGAGSFNLPYAFQQGGVYICFLLITALGFVSAYTVDLLGRVGRFCTPMIQAAVRDEQGSSISGQLTTTHPVPGHGSSITSPSIPV
jgi:hypothetical protein